MTAEGHPAILHPIKMEKTESEAAEPKPGEDSRPQIPAPLAAAESPGSPAPAAPKLTPEEQMALYEKELKETDWGHQPC